MIKIYCYYLPVILSLLFIFNAAGSDKKTKILSAKTSDAPVQRLEDINIFFEDWENGNLGNWLINEPISIPPKWHLTDWMAHGGSGLSWHMADTTLGDNGGYNNAWYQVLDTDTFTLAGTNLQLSFYQRYSVEDPGGEPAGFDGWDGINVRVSADTGKTWTVLTDPAPAYSSNSLYSFGYEHNEGTGIPGWTGTQNNWTLTTFDLSAYAGQMIRIRFAFASDPGYSTPDEPSFFGWQIDSILVSGSGGTLYNNNGSPDGINPGVSSFQSANLWKVDTVNAFSGVNFASCNNDSTYLPDLKNTLTSEWFYLDTMATDIYLDFYLRGTWGDNDEFPDVDHLGAYIQVMGEEFMRYMSNITRHPAGDDFVYSDAAPDWNLFTDTYSITEVDLTPLKGDSVRIIFEFRSDSDAPIGKAVQIDDIAVWTPALVDVTEAVYAPAAFNLEQNYPNPFNPSTKIRFSLPEKALVRLSVYNILGEEIMILVNEVKEAGTHEADLNGSFLSSGVYFYKIVSGNMSQTRKMILTK